MATSKWSKFVLLMWKNWLLQWRHKIQTLVEIFIPVLFSALLVLIRSLVDPDVINNPTIFQPIEISDIDHLRVLNITTPAINYKLSYSPKNDELEKLVNTAAEFLKIKGVVSFNNSMALETGLAANNYFAGIEFDDSLSSLTSTLPNKLTYSIRFPSELRADLSLKANPLIMNWRTNFLFPPFQTLGPRNNDSEGGGLPPGYYEEGFLSVQNAISRTFIEMKTALGSVPALSIQRYPYPPYIDDVLLLGLESFVSLIILLSFVYPCINLVKFITTEKEKQLKEAMKIMGLPSWLHWTAWFFKALIFMFISTSFIILLIKISWYPDTSVSVFTYSNWFALWLFLFIYSISTITFCFMMSVFFSKANTAAAVTGLVWFIIYTPYTFTQQNYGTLSLTEKLLVCLFSNTSMAYGFRLILRLEGTGTGIQFDNYWSPVTPDDNLSLGLLTIMLIIDTVLYLIIALYVEKINPGAYGVPEKFYFPFTKKFWCGVPEYTGIANMPNGIQNHDNIENEPLDKYAGIQIRGLRKVYSNKKVAVNNLSLNMYEDQITVLLGHNGAGKTTTMSMLTGMFPPSSGTALINGKDIRTDLEGVRSSLGLCPQHNILFDELTVREHIVFYSKLKGLDSTEIEKEVVKYVTLLELQPKINAPASTLSGGMQRKLSVCVALCGGSKVVLCDEPTSGMDPAARRALWDLLQQEKKNRTILLSTHFMDEADILGDRIAIMAEGNLKACGSSFYLKKRFGVGYHLICVKAPNSNISGVTALLQKYVPTLTVKTNIGTELSYELSDEYVEKFEVMLKDLEEHSNHLGLLGYGVSLTTLEEVFMKIGSDSIGEIDRNEFHSSNEHLNENIDHENGSVITMSSTDTTKLLNGSKLIVNQVVAMFEKKFLYTIRNWLLFLIQIIIPMAFIILTVLIVRSFAAGQDLPSLPISIDPYLNTITVLETDNNTTVQNVVKEYSKLFNQHPDTHMLEETSDRFENYILKLSETLLSRVNAKYMIGATISNNKTVAWFNNQAYHTSALSLNKLHNAFLKANNCSDECEINVINKPLPYRVESRLLMLQAGNNLGFQLAFNMGFALSFISAFYVLFYVKERVGRAKLLQFVSGVNVYIFWLTAFLWDYMTYVITTLISLATLAAFQEEGFATFAEICRVALVWLCFGFGMLPLTYLFSMLFTIPSTGFVRLTIYNIFTGIAFFSITFIMSFDQFNLEKVAKALTWIFLFFPHFAFSDAISKLNTIDVASKACKKIPFDYEMINICDKLPICCVKNHFQWAEFGAGRHIFFMILVGLIAIVFLLLIELRIIETLIYKILKLFKRSQPPLNEENSIDEDVLAEKNKITAMSSTEISQQSLVLNKVTKLYKNFLAVNQLSVAVSHSECFGLLGINGAGKTSTFKMLTGDEKISAGEASVKGMSLKKNMNRVHQIIGYCPQFDALIEDLTGREILRMFCLLRGVPVNEIKSMIYKLSTDLNFSKHIDKTVKEYSGGNKRKLSTAVALIGNPVVVYLDEPTTGMDPGAKRQLWNMVCKIRNSGKTIILTSHSMEECEALCTRLAIMVNGEFKCLGSTQYLKNKFSKGYLLTIKIKRRELESNSSTFSNETIFGEIIREIEVQNSNKSNDGTNLVETTDKIKLFVTANFSGAELKEEYQGLLSYYIPNNNQKWSEMFGIMQAGKTKLNIEDYSLSQTSLEQVFLSFTKYQRDETKAK